MIAAAVRMAVVQRLLVLTLQVPHLWLVSYTLEDACIPVLAACVPTATIAAQAGVIFDAPIEKRA